MNNTDFKQKYGPWAFVAGASMGLGAALSHGAAARGLNVVMLARGEQLLRETAGDVRDKHGVEVRVLAGDLAGPGIGNTIADATADLEIGLLVYNATYAPHGRFLDVPMDENLKSITINCITMPVLCNLFGKKMAERQRGGIALLGSLAATSGALNFAVYHAGKAFEWNFAETLWTELGELGIDVTAMLIGSMSSPSYLEYVKYLDPAYAGRPDAKDPLERARARLFNPSAPEDVVRALYEQLPNGPVCYPNPADQDLGTTSFSLPRTEAIAVWRGLQETPMRTS
jgi:short-subunit dehydrogenase